MLVSPVPSMLQKLFAGKVVFLNALGSKLFNNLCLSSNRSMVGTGYPKCILAFHAGTTHQNILDGVVQHVSHVEHASHIGWGNHDCIGFPAIRFRTEQLVIKPILIPF